MWAASMMGVMKRIIVDVFAVALAVRGLLVCDVKTEDCKTEQGKGSSHLEISKLKTGRTVPSAIHGPVMGQ